MTQGLRCRSNQKGQSLLRGPAGYAFWVVLILLPAVMKLCLLLFQRYSLHNAFGSCLLMQLSMK
jgi:hypothetical protein